MVLFFLPPGGGLNLHACQVLLPLGLVYIFRKALSASHSTYPYPSPGRRVLYRPSSFVVTYSIIDVAVEQQPEVRLEGWTGLHISSYSLLNTWISVFHGTTRLGSLHDLRQNPYTNKNIVYTTGGIYSRDLNPPIPPKH